MLQTILVAIQLKQHARPTTLEARADAAEATATVETGSATERQQAENMVQISYHSIRAMVGSAEGNDTSSDVEDTNPEEQERQLQSRKPERDDSAMWLYGLVFSPTIDAEAQELQGTKADELSSQDKSEATSQRTTQELEIHHRQDEGPLQLFVREVPKERDVVNELLSEWTTLTEKGD
ncbi:hypothetical protein PG991_001600 [Apiospora marii]|uniref:Uncharacterized protein n=1 Tax=Apiospora marii TaxID=335849 RepID=A0ABR1SQ49_9PEZI